MAMDLRSILPLALQQQSIPGLLSLLQQQGGGGRRRAVPQPVSPRPVSGGSGAVPPAVSGGSGAVPQSVASMMAASNAMTGSGGSGGDFDMGSSPQPFMGPYGALIDPMMGGKGIFSWEGHDPRLPLGPVTSKNGIRVGVPVEGNPDRYQLPDGSFSETFGGPGPGAANWWSELHRPTSDPMSAGSFRPAPQFGPGYYWSTTGELGQPGQGQYAAMWGSGGP